MVDVLSEFQKDLRNDKPKLPASRNMQNNHEEKL